ncbi:MAG: isochorismatase family cysteine hydrolase [Phycisphaerae bacterium]
MSTAARRKGFDRVLLDLNTQCDYLLPSGAAPVVNRAGLISNIRKLFEWARSCGVPVISSLNAHRPDEPVNGMPRHCVDRTPGQKKLPFTLLPRRILLDGDNTLDLPHDLLGRYRQVVFAKRSRDLLSNPKADRLLTEMPESHVIIFGVLTEYCVKATVLGLLTRRRNVVVVSDACGHWNAPEAELAMRQMDAKGAFLIPTDQILQNAPLPVRLFPVAPEEGRTNGEHAANEPAGDNGVPVGSRMSGSGSLRLAAARRRAASPARGPVGRPLP